MTAAPLADRLPADYAALSGRYVEQGDRRMAQLAAWAADVHALERLLWENGLDQAPDPAAGLRAVGESVALAIEELAHALPTGPLTVRGLVEAARDALIATFDESVHGLLADRFEDLGQLDRQGPWSGTDRESRTTARLDGRTAEALAADLRTAAADCTAMTDLLAAGDEAVAARRLSAQADAAAFEAHLVTAALAAGDDTLVTVDLRWDLAAGADAEGDPADRRDRLAGVLGTAERDQWSRSLDAGHGS